MLNWPKGPRRGPCESPPPACAVLGSSPGRSTCSGRPPRILRVSLLKSLSLCPCPWFPRASQIVHASAADQVSGAVSTFHPVRCHAALLESSMARPMETRMYDRLSNFRSKMSGQERGWGYRDADEHRGVGARKRSGKFIRPVSIIRSERSERKFVGAGVSVRITAGLANSRRMKLRERKAQVSAKKSDRHY